MPTPESEGFRPERIDATHESEARVDLRLTENKRDHLVRLLIPEIAGTKVEIERLAQDGLDKESNREDYEILTKSEFEMEDLLRELLRLHF